MFVEEFSEVIAFLGLSGKGVELPSSTLITGLRKFLLGGSLLREGYMFSTRETFIGCAIP